MGFAGCSSILEWVHKKNKIEENGINIFMQKNFYVTEKLYFEPEIPKWNVWITVDTDEKEMQVKIKKYIEDNRTSKER